MIPPHEVTILAVDDDPGHIELIRRNLIRTGFNNELITMHSGEEALDFVYCRGKYAGRVCNRYLLVLLDINMPGMDGVEVLRRLKSDPEKSKIPVIMLTTTDDPREVERCYTIGCSVYITKPISPESFMDAVRRLGLFISVVNFPQENGA